MGEGSRDETAELVVDGEAETTGVGMDEAASFGICDAGLLAVEGGGTSVMSPFRPECWAAGEAASFSSLGGPDRPDTPLR